MLEGEEERETEIVQSRAKYHKKRDEIKRRGRKVR